MTNAPEMRDRSVVRLSVMPSTKERLANDSLEQANLMADRGWGQTELIRRRPEAHVTGSGLKCTKCLEPVAVSSSKGTIAETNSSTAEIFAFETATRLAYRW